MLALTFGTADEAASVARGINAIHDRTYGRLGEAAGIFREGTAYSARDPALLRRVHATLVDSFVLTYELYVGPLSLAEKDRYCFEASAIEPMLGIPPGYLPRTMGQLQSYMAEMFASGEITVSKTALALADQVLYPPFPWPTRPLLWLMRLPTAGTLPDTIRRAYDLPWDARREKALRLSAKLIRTVLPLVPRSLRYWRSYRTAAARFGKQKLEILKI
jgi:uncharacterized protein (DUF2236 family)